MYLHLNIDIWLDKNSNDIYINNPPEGVEASLVKANTPILHTADGAFSRRIKDLKIIFGSSCLPEIDRKGGAWSWEGLASRQKLKR